MNIQQCVINTFRPKTLSASFVPVLAGTFLFAGHLNPLVMLSLLLTVVCLQMGTNFINDALDFKKGADNENRIGPLRMVQAGVLSQKQVYQFGLLFFAASLVTAIPFIEVGGLLFAVLLIFSIGLGYCYTGGPVPIAYRGLGEVFVFAFFGIAATVSAVYLQIHTVPFMGWIAGSIIGFHSCVMISVNNLRDIKGDKEANKRTLAVRFGEDFAKKKLLFFIFFPYLLNLLWLVNGNYYAAFLPYLSLPLAVNLAKGILDNPPSPIYNTYLQKGGILHILFALLMVIGARWT